MSEIMECPKCKANLDGGEIFAVIRKHDYYKDMSDKDLRKTLNEGYGDCRKHFSRVIGIQIHDRRNNWMCPDCEHEWGFRGKEGK